MLRVLPLAAALLAAAPIAAQPDLAFSVAPLGDGGSFGLPGFSESIAPIADLDGDGVRDFLLIQPDFCLSVNGLCDVVGRVYAFSGADGQVLYTIDPSPTRSFFSESLAVGPDIDGDGVPEVAVGGNTFVYLFSGADGAELARFASGDGDALFGTAAWVPDVDGDGTDDVAFGAISSFNETGTRTGAVTLVSGASFAQIGRTALSDAAGEARFGGTVALLGDSDGDGTPEIVVSAHDENSSSVVDGGRVYRVELVPGLAEAPELLAEGTKDSGLFGIALAVLDDLDGDGVRDVAVTGQEDAARAVFVVSGADGSTLFEPQDPFVSPVLEFGIGAGLGRAGDLDGDGVGDVLVGDPVSLLPDLSFTSFVHAYSGADGAYLFSIEDPMGSPAPNVGEFGTSVVGDDLDGDGRPEILVGAPLDSRAYVFRLPPSTAAEDGAAPVAEASLLAYPNPARETLHLVTESATPGRIVVTDALGRTVHRTETLGRTSLDVRGWAPGLYLIRLSTGNATVLRAVTVAR